VFYLGCTLILAGLGILGYVGWQLFGTNVVAHHEQQQLVTRLQTQWRSPTGHTAGDRPAEDRPTEAGEAGEARALIRIPRFGADYVMPVLPGITADQLARGFGHFPGSADPGQVGNYALAAHRVTHGQPLREMPELRPGDTVVVETRAAVHTYVLDTDPNALVVDFTDVWVVDPLPKNPDPGGVQPAQRTGQRLVTLTTCAELFHTDNRMIAFGHLLSTTPR
jgi:sortase A